MLRALQGAAANANHRAAWIALRQAADRV